MVSRTVVLAGHLLDSLLLSKLLDELATLGVGAEVVVAAVGSRREEPSTITLRIDAGDTAAMVAAEGVLARHGFGDAAEAPAVHLVLAPADGVFPELFYATTNLPTRVHHAGRWWEVAPMEMDCGLVWLDDHFACVRVGEVRAEQPVVVGEAGVEVEPVARPRRGETFTFMASDASVEEPKGARIRAVAEQCRATHAAGCEILWVAGPAVVHTGGGDALARLVAAGWVDRLYTGNALAVHDIEEALYGTALGRETATDRPTDGGHCHHLRAINRIRGVGSIAAACAAGLLTRGVMHTCWQRGVPVVLAGSIRDDGPLPDTITDVMAAQRAMRAGLGRVGMCIMVATTLHGIAVGNLLPATCGVVMVDINPSVVTKLADRGTSQGEGLVTDAAYFLSVLAGELIGAPGVH